MNTAQYHAAVLKTESNDFPRIGKDLADKRRIRLLHAAIGMCTETGEIQDQLKKHIFYNKPLDEVNLKEELGDLAWYLFIMLDALGITLEEVCETNIEKLKARYGEKFSEERSGERDLAAEREVLEHHRSPETPNLLYVRFTIPVDRILRYRLTQRSSQDMLGKPLVIEDQNVGTIVSVNYSPVTMNLEMCGQIDRNKHPDLVKRIEEGQLADFSIVKH